MNIKINESQCWICGGEKSITVHHTIPKHLNPKKNVLVPVCRPCHNKIHETDVAGMYAFIEKIQRSLRTTEGEIKALKNIVENHAVFNINTKNDN